MAIANVGPNTITKSNSRNANPMLSWDRRWTPLSTPETTEARATAVIAMMSSTIVVTVLGMPKR